MWVFSHLTESFFDGMKSQILIKLQVIDRDQQIRYSCLVSDYPMS